MKQAIKKILSVICLTAIIVSSLSLFASAASISSNKHKATGVNASQTVYIKSNTGWNTELFGDLYRTKVKILLAGDYYEIFQYNLTTGLAAKLKVTIYKKSGSSWSKYSQGTYNCNNKGYLSVGCNAKTFLLPGKGVNYKIVFTPVIDEPVSSYLEYNEPADLKNITVSITSYGTITSVK